MEKMRYFLDGPGEVLIVATDFDLASPDVSKILCVVTAKTASFGSSVEQEDVTGGRSLAPRRKILTGRDVTFELSDCEMDFRYVALSQGEDALDETADSLDILLWAFGEDHQHLVSEAGGFDLAYEPETVGGESSLILIDEEGDLVEGGSVTGKAVTGLVAYAGKVVKATYQYEAPEGYVVKQVTTFNDSIPKTVKIIHHQPMFDEDNQTIGFQEIEIYRASVSGEFEEAYEERSPFAPSLSFELLDPKRHDKKIVDHRMVKYPVAGS
jgi:hypothetical protein